MNTVDDRTHEIEYPHAQADDEILQKLANLADGLDVDEAAGMTLEWSGTLAVNTLVCG